MSVGLRGPTGEPSLRVRLLSLLFVVALLILTAPFVVIPLLHWLLGSALP